jgi:hypothetical protein
MATGDIITATRYNQIQATINSVLGVGAANSGYGQQLESSQIAATQIVTADHMNKLRRDMLTCFVHQRGSNTGFVLPVLVSGTDLVSDSPSGVGKNEYDSYPTLANTLLDDRNDYTTQAVTSNFSLESNRIVSIRNTPWGGSQQSQTIAHEVRIKFASLNARRHFFNTGSELRFEATLTNFPGGDGQDKFNSWAGMLSGMGTIIFNSTETSSTGSGTGQPIGNFNLTSDYQIVFIKTGSLLYSDNTYIVKAKVIDSSTLSFLIEFNDLHTGSSSILGSIYGVDTPVEGILTSRVHQFRATGTSISNISKVIAPTPVYQNTRNL